MKYSLDELAILWLDSFKFLDFSIKKNKILNLFSSPSELFKINNKKQEVIEIVGEENYNDLIKNSNNDYVKNILSNLGDIKFTTKYSNDFPKCFLEIDECPIIIYYLGDLSLIGQKCVGVVGTRTPTNYGKIITASLVKDLSKHNIVIASGLAYGVDSIAHSTCLENNGKTVAVVAGGLKNIYPSTNLALSKEIAKKGLIISEYRPDLKATKYTFPYRNRLIACISNGILITEAKLKSGSLHTKEYALNYNKEIFVVPGNINSKESEGTNRLIKSCQGLAVTCVDDILDILKVDKNQNLLNCSKLSSNENLILKILGSDEVHYNDILSKSDLDTKTLNSLLTKMEFDDMIKKLAGNYFCKI